MLGDNYALDLRRAPDVRQACTEAYGTPHEPMAVAFTELLGVIGAHQWRLKGVEIPFLGARIHPHYGVFSPVRGSASTWSPGRRSAAPATPRSTSARGPECWPPCRLIGGSVTS
ncbi:hypothetical protein ACQP2K_25435 [Microbispora siamensis]